MKNAIYVFALLATANALCAQEWAPLGTTWQYYSENDAGGQYFYKITVQGDTIVGGQPCRKLDFVRQIPDTDSTVFLYAGFTFERNDSVFVWDQAAAGFLLNYDFSAQVGDTISIPFYEFLENRVDTFRVVLESRNVALAGFNQVPLERYQVRNISGYPSYVGDAYYRGVGSLSIWNGFPSTLPSVGISLQTLRCYEGGNIMLYMNQAEAPCSMPSPVASINGAGKFIVFPNPSSRAFQFDYALPTHATLALYAATGQLVGQYALNTGGSPFEWAPKTGGSGLYYYRVIDSEGTVYHAGKLIFINQ